MTPTLVRHRFSVNDYEEMIARGILTPSSRVELLRGEIITKMSIGDEHAGCVNCLNRLLHQVVGSAAIVGIQNPIRLPDSEPEPDVTLARPRADFYRTGKPRPADILLVIEVADTSLDVDRDVKRPLYAENGIVEYWIVNLHDSCVEVHRRPQPDGTYADVTIRRSGETVDVEALPGCVLSVDHILG